MAWTTEEIASVKAAIIALATGKAVASVSYAGPPAQTISYQATDLDKLKALLAQMTASSSTSVTYRRASVSKGFG